MLPRLFVLFAGLSLAATLAAQSSADSMQFVPASDSHFRYDGRFDLTKPRQAVAIWSGSRIGLEFSGDRLVLIFDTAIDQSVFNVTVDGVTELLDIRRGPGLRWAWPKPLATGRHRLELFKRSEASKGHVAFRGVELARDAKVWTPPAPTGPKFAFFGDSITAGACNEDGATDQWDDYRTHNYAKSWAHLTALACGADDRAVAYSGMGVITGWEVIKAREVWDRLYPRADSVPADLSGWQPDIVFVNLGENDDSFTHAHQQPFPADFTAGYVQLIRAIRGAYPRAQFVLLRGGMMGGAKSVPYREAWEKAVQEIEAGNPRTTHFVFQHAATLHPRVADDEAMAAELTAWLKRQSFLPGAR